MRQLRGIRAILASGVCSAVLLASPAAHAQSNEELLRRLDAMQRRMDELETALREATRAPRPAAQAPAAAVAPPRAPRPSPPPAAIAQAAAPVGTPAPAPAAAPRVTREEVDEALRGSMPNSWRIPGTDTSVRLYGFVKANLFSDLDMVNRSDAPSVQGIPLIGSAATQQSGDTQFSARRSRIGFDTSTPTGLGPATTKIEFDFAGDQPSPSGAATSSGYMPRLRQAYVQLGGDVFSVLVGQANSVWNDGFIETLTDSTFVNASAVRQAQIRVTGRLAQGLTGQLSLEAPYTDYTSNAGVFYPDSSLDGGASPSTTTFPDLVGRLTYRGDFGDVSLRGLLRQLSIDTNGTNATPKGTADTLGWGFAAGTNLNLRGLWRGFGADQVSLMAYYGEGIGRYFDATTSGQSAFSNIGLPGVTDVSLAPVPTYGASIGYRHYWIPTLRSNAAYGYARVDNPAFVSQFAAGGSGATAANRDMQMGVVNLIWSPFATERDDRISNGWLDVGIEYIYFRRDLQDGSIAAPVGQGGYGIEQRIQASAIARF
ncbi:DcaP family trimeric outer membrane transporter [Roseomonas sp. AR75]|uniref:DcaP family trimeric outer membrane transporter n=1 Tax=Roseomonas sp. AR75 TaxID=2562311 RepID=UPI001485184E|nr:DcaP family trimeric outer membrane transporter [Roseomonas sp. AR75]